MAPHPAAQPHDALLTGLRRDYAARNPRSQQVHARVSRFLVDGINHDARWLEPFPFRITAAHGAYVQSLDGHHLVDYWQGHYANILGHNPPLVCDELASALLRGDGLQTGFAEERQAELAAALAEASDADRVRLTTSGTLATMYALMLARGFTGRELVLKLSGGWHGANPLALKATDPSAGAGGHSDSAGVSRDCADHILVTRFNDVESLRAVFRQHGDRIAAFIFEPCMGYGGFVPASPEFMHAARELTAHYGALLILDEVITGFRYCAAGLQKLYGVRSDLCVFGKIIGGGLPIAAVAGRADVMAMVSKGAPRRVWFSGGTFSGHPLTMLAGLSMIRYLREHEAEVYPALCRAGERLRSGIERVFADRGILARCTGRGSGPIPAGSLGWVHFPLGPDDQPVTCAEDLYDPSRSDVVLREQALKLGLLLHDVNVMHGLGAISTAHSDDNIERTLAAYDGFAQRLRGGR